jgi:DNA-binding transcriptional regulator/RsmH inhibitor MraZ
VLPTQRLSPKNQVTIPRDARALTACGEVDHLRGMTHAITKSGTNQSFPVLILVTEDELKRREQKITEDPALTQVQKVELVTLLNGGAASMAIDGQHRVVLPPHFVEYLKLDRDVFFVCTNSVIQVWNPDDYLAWSGRSEQPAPNPALSAYLVI